MIDCVGAVYKISLIRIKTSYVQDQDVTNPYQATDSTNATGGTLSDSFVNWIPLTLLTFAGLILGAIGYFAAAVILETRNVESEQILSYGQQAGLISAPLCAIMCAMIGMSFGLVVGRKAFFGTVTLIATGCVGGLAVNSMWLEQIAEHGRSANITQNCRDTTLQPSDPTEEK